MPTVEEKIGLQGITLEKEMREESWECLKYMLYSYASKRILQNIYSSYSTCTFPKK